jgi:hypothetical protein
MKDVLIFKAALLTFLKMEAQSFNETLVAYTNVHSVISQTTGKIYYYRCDNLKTSKLYKS